MTEITSNDKDNDNDNDNSNCTKRVLAITLEMGPKNKKSATA